MFSFWVIKPSPEPRKNTYFILYENKHILGYKLPHEDETPPQNFDIFTPECVLADYSNLPAPSHITKTYYVHKTYS